MSPDRKSVASLYRFITAMWGGPDTLYVTIRRDSFPWAEETVYRVEYECDDVTAFDLRWKDSEHLTISYGACGTGDSRWEGPNNTLKKLTTSGRISIEYTDTGHVAVK